jgi:hypothetical protein
MKLFVLGVKRVHGVKKDGGDPFDMCTLYGGAPVEKMDRAGVHIMGYGLDVGEIDATPEAVAAFEKVTLPAEVDLVTEPRLYRGEFKTFVVGVAPAAAPRKAA